MGVRKEMTFFVGRGVGVGSGRPEPCGGPKWGTVGLHKPSRREAHGFDAALWEQISERTGWSGPPPRQLLGGGSSQGQVGSMRGLGQAANVLSKVPRVMDSWGPPDQYFDGGILSFGVGGCCPSFSPGEGGSPRSSHPWGASLSYWVRFTVVARMDCTSLGGGWWTPGRPAGLWLPPAT